MKNNEEGAVYKVERYSHPAGLGRLAGSAQGLSCS